MNILGNLISLDEIMDSHTGSPKERVKIRCLEVLKEYGTRPIKLIIMIEIKIEDTVLLSPFRWKENVRFNWDMMVDFIRKIDIDVRLFDGQKDS